MVLALACASAVAQDQTGSVAGRVSNLLTGSPVRKAKVLLGGDRNPEQYRALTDSEGRYAIAGIAPGRYRMSVGRTGFLPVQYGAHGPNRPGKTVLVAAAEVKQGINFQIEPPAVITGHIYDDDGEPLSIPVLLWRVTWQDGLSSLYPLAGATANDEGEYRIFGLASGTYIAGTALSGRGPGVSGVPAVPSRDIYAPAFYPGTEDLPSATPLKLVPGSEARDIDFHLHKTQAVQIRGSVISSGPEQIFSLSLNRRDGAKLPATTLMHNNRDFAFANVVPGSYTLTATTAGGEQPSTGTVNVDAGTADVEDVRISISPAAIVPGQLLVDGEKPHGKGRMQVLLTRVTQDVNESPVYSNTDASGAFHWRNPRPGLWRVKVNPLSDGMYLQSPTEIEVDAKFQGPVTVAVSSHGAEITGKVSSAGVKHDPAEGATVLVMAEGTQPRVVKYAVTGPDGSYWVLGVPPGKYRVVALEDIETLSWEDPSVVAALKGPGAGVELPESGKAALDLTLSMR